MMKPRQSTTNNKRRVGEVAKVISGYAFKSSEFGSDGIPVIKIKNIRVGITDLEDAERVDPKFLSLDERYHVKGGDLLISLTGSHLSQPDSVVGRVAIHSSTHGHCLLNQRAGKIIVTQPEGCDLLYLYYSLSTQDLRRTIALMASGTASQANISPSQVESVQIVLPPLPTQRRIASILSAYDDLIENNTRRIKILEQMAQALYREWFVEFRAPGVKLRKATSEEQKVTGKDRFPAGWEVKKVKDALARLAAGNVYTAADVAERGQVQVVDQSRDLMLGFHDNEPDHLASPDKPVVIFGDHTCKMQLMVEPFSVGPNVVPFVAANGMPTLYVYFLVNSLVETQEYKRHWTELTAKQVTVASSLIAEQFSQLVAPMFAQIDMLMRKNANLRQTRDLLLPRLVGGEIEVS
jgi:type I restriction enzyme, S subunit